MYNFLDNRLSVLLSGKMFVYNYFYKIKLMGCAASSSKEVVREPESVPTQAVVNEPEVIDEA